MDIVTHCFSDQTDLYNAKEIAKQEENSYPTTQQTMRKGTVTDVNIL